MSLILCWYHSKIFSPLKWMWPSSHLRSGSRQFFEFLLIKPVVWMNCIVPLSYENTLLLLVFTLLKKNKRFLWGAETKKCCGCVKGRSRDLCVCLCSYRDHVLRSEFGGFSLWCVCWQWVDESTESVLRHCALRRENKRLCFTNLSHHYYRNNRT